MSTLPATSTPTVTTGSKKVMDMFNNKKKVIIIVVIVILFLIVSIGGIAYWRYKKMKEQQNPITGAMNAVVTNSLGQLITTKLL